MAVDKLVDSSQLDADLTAVANAIRAKSGGSGQLAFPSGFVNEIGNISGGGTPAKTKSGTFTGSGSRQVSIPCDFEPDLVFWYTDTGSSAFSGTRHGIIARGLMAINRYSNNSTNITNAITAPYITGMNTGGSGYAMRATYSNGNVNIYCFTSAARSYFKSGQTYNYFFAKYTV